MLEKDPEHRIDLTSAINHPWVTVEGSIRPEGLEISVESGCSDDDGQVQVGLRWLSSLRSRFSLTLLLLLSHH